MGTEYLDLTARQREFLDCYAALYRELAMPPTIRELMGPLAIESPNGVCCHLKAMARHGWLLAPAGKSVASRQWRPTVRLLERIFGAHAQPAASPPDVLRRFGLSREQAIGLLSDLTLALAEPGDGDPLDPSRAKAVRP